MELISRIFNINNSLRLNARLVLPVLLLCFIGLIALKSTSVDTLGVHSIFYKQLIWIFIGILSFTLFQFLRLQILYEFSYVIYLVLVLMLIATHFMPEINNASRWLVFGSITFQPSELGKMFMVITLSRFLSDYKETFSDHQIIIFSLIIVFIPASLIALQPDYGTSVIYILLLIPMLYWCGVKTKKLLIWIFPFITILAAFNLLTFSIWMIFIVFSFLLMKFKINQIIFNFSLNSLFGLFTPYIWNNMLHTYHKKRILSLFFPQEGDALGIGYQLFQSKVAIGSGGLLGKGLGEGTQSFLRFLPIKDSDFILSVISEEMGFFAILLIVTTFIFFIYYNIDYAQRIFNKFHSLNIVGFSSVLYFHMLINLCMVIGLFPVIGLPFPFISYGGSFLLSCFLLVAIINNIINNDI